MRKRVGERERHTRAYTRDERAIVFLQIGRKGRERKADCSRDIYTVIRGD